MPCREDRRDGGAAFHCHHCQMAGNVPSDAVRDRGERPAAPVRRQRPPAPIPPAVDPAKPETMYQWFQGRGIGRETVDRFGCYVAEHFMLQTGKPERCMVFPYVYRGDLINRKYRDAAKNFAQEKGAARTLFNVDTLAGHDTAIFVEGEPDVLAMVEAGFPNVVTLPDGSPPMLRDEMDPTDKRYEALATCADDLTHIQRFIIAGDMDGPGRNHAEELVRRLGREKCWRVTWPTVNDAPRKDANETLQLDGASVVRECIDAAEPYPIKGVYSGDDYAQDLIDFYENGHKRGLSTGWPELDKILTIRPGDLTIVTGIPNDGKSEFLDALFVNMARAHGWKFGLCSFENSPPEHLAKLAEKYLHTPFFDGYTRRMSRCELAAAHRWLGHHFHFVRAEDDSPTIEWILEKARVLVQRSGIRGFCLDPWSDVEHTRPGNMTETEYIGKSLATIRRFAKANDVHVWVVAHPRSLQAERQGEKPMPGLYQISGSANWANKADFGLTIYRPDNDVPLTEVHVLKSRFKWLGQKGSTRLRYLKATGEYSDDLEALA